MSGQFQLSAEGDALETTIVDPSAPLIQNYSASPYGASASLSSLGSSLAAAGAPFAPTVSGLPSLVNGLGSGGLLPYVPPLPGYTSSSYPGTPKGEQVIDGYDLTATSSSTESTGNVAVGAQVPGATEPTMFATADTVSNSDGSVTASAKAGADVLNFGQLFDIGNLSSSATMTVPTSGTPTGSVTEDLGTITLLGIKNGLTLDGFNALGVREPLPLTGTVIATVNQLLAASGVQVSYLPATFSYTDGSTSTGSAPQSGKTLQGLESGALQIVEARNVPSQGNVTATFTVGRIYLSATNSAFGSSDGDGSLSTSDTGSGATSSPDLGSSVPFGPQSGSVVSADSGAASLGETPGLAAEPSSGAGSITPTNGASSPAPVLSTPPGGSSQRPTALAGAVEGPSNESFYLIMVLGAAVVFVGTQLMRILAVRQLLHRRRRL